MDSIFIQQNKFQVACLYGPKELNFWTKTKDWAPFMMMFKNSATKENGNASLLRKEKTTYMEGQDFSMPCKYVNLQKRNAIDVIVYLKIFK